MEKQQEGIQPVDEEALEQAAGGVETPEPQEERPAPQILSRPPGANQRFI